MDEISYGKWGGWRASLCILLYFVAAITITAQPGFLSIDCGTKTNHTDVNHITWVGDADYIEVGQEVGEVAVADIGNATEEFYGFYLTNLRFFPRPPNKSCYSLPVDPHVPYLVRLWFSARNFSRFQKISNFAFSLETEGTLYMKNITIPYGILTYAERILASSGKVLYICLIRTLESDDPFISAIELRKLQNGMYGQPQPGTILRNIWRTDVSGENSTRYPQDTFDRIWRPFVPLNVSSLDIGEPVSSDSTLINNTKDFPPHVVMQTAWVLNNSEPAQFSLGAFDGGSKSLLVLYFAEIQTLDKSESRSFYVMINGEKWPDTITLPRSFSALELRILTNQTDDFQFAFVMASNSTLPPIINAFEYYTLFDTQLATYLQDVEALVAMKEMFDMSAWISDPCFLIEWDGIACNHDSSAIRISEINLSQRRNMTGLIPEQIGQLTALVNMVLDNNHFTGSLPDFSNLTMLQRLHLGNNNLSGSVPDWLSELQNLKELVLDNNHLMGPLPDLSNLTMLEKLHLQNNLLNGSVPDWLSKLKNLKELFIENNNFSGEIAPQLLQKHSLELKYYGNNFLFPDLIGHTPQNPNRKLKKYLVLGIALGGVLIISLSLIVGIALYPKKKDSVTTESNGVEMIVHSAPNESIDPTIMVSNSAKAYAFTLDQVTAATGKFSGNIGKGGFGTVFFGKLLEGTDIAVKVLTLFSTQGVKQFLNEIDVLSRVQHENLVSLLGYCNESQELMIIYEYMSGGSLRDRLYGPNAGSELSWKTRVKIALDAAQGLEYLHTVCTPKIIHRDVKAANILLDSNLKGKLGDFGISRIWTAGEASHVTTMVKGTAGYLDPEYFSTERLTEKSDVYSFGVVLLEIICGRQPIDAKLSLDKLNIIRWATPFVEMDAIPGKIEEIIDERLCGNYDIKSVTRVAKVAIRCVKAEPFYRPSVSEVVAELREALQIEGNCNTISNVLS